MDEWDIQKYRIKLRHDLKLALLKIRFDKRSELTREVALDHYLVNTRSERSGYDQGRCDLEEALYKNDGRFDG